MPIWETRNLFSPCQSEIQEICLLLANLGDRKFVFSLPIWERRTYFFLLTNHTDKLLQATSFLLGNLRDKKAAFYFFIWETKTLFPSCQSDRMKPFFSLPVLGTGYWVFCSPNWETRYSTGFLLASLKDRKNNFCSPIGEKSSLLSSYQIWGTRDFLFLSIIETTRYLFAAWQPKGK